MEKKIDEKRDEKRAVLRVRIGNRGRKKKRRGKTGRVSSASPESEKIVTENRTLGRTVASP